MGGLLLSQYIDNKIKENNEKRYYVGCLILDTKNTNPKTYLGFGTWSLWGSGRVPVGVDTSDSDFNAAEKTGGEKSHKLTIPELPKHKPSITSWINSNSQVWGDGVNNNRAFTNVASDGNGTSQTADDFKGIGYVGEDKAHNNLQPYITCYIWKRIS